ncbi:endothelial zinc finger protein induced by tumor necrosis factor alpha [Drosophila kikkawai]|uniref:Endothelial zinc finger protein induced by tumor necrosis factor alpha n=1 Tax=Drosophila kikkawai TaxID=30033 RepID=A0A6P4JI80_DROKI|nr:zinc finger protein 675 [Drosophila kikkawai]
MESEDQNNNYGVCLEELQLFAQLEEGLTGDLELELLELRDSSEQKTPKPMPPQASTANHKLRRRGTSSSSSGHTCDTCGRRFSEAYNLRIHKMTHTDEKPHVCGDCGKGFRQLNKLRIHAVTHTEERPHKCDICGKGFRYANYLAVHRRLHTGEKPYPCLDKKCAMVFHSIHARRIHQKLQHAGDIELLPLEEHREADTSTSTSSLSFTCPVCGRILTDQCYLSTHLKRHYNQRDFACPQPECGKSFFSASELKHHQIAHTQLRPFACPLCPARFLRKSNYKQHLKVHER